MASLSRKKRDRKETGKEEEAAYEKSPSAQENSDAQETLTKCKSLQDPVAQEHGESGSCTYLNATESKGSVKLHLTAFKKYH